MSACSIFVGDLGVGGGVEEDVTKGGASTSRVAHAGIDGSVAIGEDGSCTVLGAAGFFEVLGVGVG